MNGPLFIFIKLPSHNYYYYNIILTQFKYSYYFIGVLHVWRAIWCALEMFAWVSKILLSNHFLTRLETYVYPFNDTSQEENYLNKKLVNSRKTRVLSTVAYVLGQHRRNKRGATYRHICWWRLRPKMKVLGPS